MWTNVKISNKKELWLKTLVDSGCTYTRINKPRIEKLYNLYY